MYQMIMTCILMHVHDYTRVHLHVHVLYHHVYTCIHIWESTCKLLQIKNIQLPSLLTLARRDTTNDNTAGPLYLAGYHY